MIKITDIAKHKDGYLVTLSSKESFYVSEQTLSQYHLYVQKELEQAEINEIKAGAEYDIAYSKALAYVTRQMRTIGETKTYLKQKDMKRITIAQVIDRLKENNYLDDHRYAKLYVEDKKQYSHDGPKKITAYLRKKKVDQPVIDHALLAYDIPEQKETIAKELEKLAKRPIRKPYYKAINSLKQKFYRYGFASYLIDEVFQSHHHLIDDMIDETESLKNELAKLKKKSLSAFEIKQTLRQKGYSSGAISSLEE